MALTNENDSTFPPSGLAPYRIHKEWCLGDSLPYLNGNFRNFDTRIDANTTAIAAASATLSAAYIAADTYIKNNTPRVYNFWHQTNLTRPSDSWSSNGSDGSGITYAIPGSTIAYSFRAGTIGSDTTTGTETLQDTNITAPYNCNLFLNYRGYWNQNGLNTYLTSPVLLTINYEYSIDNGVTWITPNNWDFTYGSAGAAFGTNPYYLVNYTPIQNAGGAAVGSVKTTMNAGQTIRFRPYWRAYPINTEQNTTRVSSMGGYGVFEIVIQPTSLNFNY